MQFELPSHMSESVRRLQVLAADHEQLRNLLWDAWRASSELTYEACETGHWTLLANPFGLKAVRDQAAWSESTHEPTTLSPPLTTLSQSPSDRP